MSKETIPRKVPVYIYPGLIRMSSERARQIDARCQPAIYNPCDEKRKEEASECAICIEQYRTGKEIIRILPCHHIFHSRCK